MPCATTPSRKRVYFAIDDAGVLSFIPTGAPVPLYTSAAGQALAESSGMLGAEGGEGSFAIRVVKRSDSVDDTGPADAPGEDGER